MTEQEQIEEMDALIRVLRQQLVAAVEAASNASARVLVLQQRLDKATQELSNRNQAIK
jgi:antirestriction protein ArdC